MNMISKTNLDVLHAVQVQTSKIYTPIAEQYGASQSGSFLDKDIRKRMNKEGRLAIEPENAHAMLDHFIQLQQENPNFFYVIDLNDEQCLRNVFWVDAKSRHDYINFNDVVYLDTTYLKKRCKMPFAPFMGTWLRAMSGVTPRVIITDEDEGMKAAVAEVLPDTHHRYEEESKADFDSKHGLPALKSHSPHGKQLSTIYTHEPFKKFQLEVLGTIACHPRKEKEDGTKTIFRVQDFEAQQNFIVTWDETK
ncbi:hypothetical protein NE237_016199 [Protea cynaroides]|uniref:Protein FAR1-RELATED SEQUENCE n=1 Tax=Protea cynaroides TaxID=273540 RepID=A0A9Q0KF56_9MAGN|nr:hypothetical protein NE237_016199 [Protea cynaroides]